MERTFSGDRMLKNSRCLCVAIERNPEIVIGVIEDRYIVSRRS